MGCKLYACSYDFNFKKYFSDQFTKEVAFYDLRYNVKPGLTGWAQVHDCYAVPHGINALQYELRPLKNSSDF